MKYRTWMSDNEVVHYAWLSELEPCPELVGRLAQIIRRERDSMWQTIDRLYDALAEEELVREGER